MFVIGISIFLLTLIIAFFVPVFYHVDTNARDIIAGPYAPSSAEHLLGILGVFSAGGFNGFLGKDRGTDGDG